MLENGRTANYRSGSKQRRPVVDARICSNRGAGFCAVRIDPGYRGPGNPRSFICEKSGSGSEPATGTLIGYSTTFSIPGYPLDRIDSSL